MPIWPSRFINKYDYYSLHWFTAKLSRSRKMCFIADKKTSSKRIPQCGVWMYEYLLVWLFRSEASLYLDRCHRLTNSSTSSRLALSTISPLLLIDLDVLRVCPLEFDKEAISDGFRSENGRYWWRVKMILKSFTELLWML